MPEIERGLPREVGMQYQLLADQPSSPTRGGQDPTQAKGRTAHAFSRNIEIVLGRVTDYVAYARCYKVQCDRAHGVLRCADLMSTGLGVYGPREHSSYPIGTQVAVLYHPQLHFHFILGSVPDWGFDARQAASDFIVPGSNVGGGVDPVHTLPWLTTANGSLIDFSSGRAWDGLSADWGAITETGLGIHLDPFLAFLRADDETGFSVFYFDQLARFAGHNLQVRSAGHEREDLDDENEFSAFTGWSPYPWEVMGAYNASDMDSITHEPEEVQLQATNRSKLEPVVEDQLSFFREQAFHGYLGQGGRKLVSIFDLSQTPDPIHRYQTTNVLQGLGEANWGLDGMYFAQSISGIILAKRPVLPTPKRINRPESETGDRTDDNYKSCGLFGSGPDHFVQVGPDVVEGSPEAVVEAASLMDQLAYLFNWKGLHPFYYHALDWYLPEATDLPQASGTDSAVQTAVPAFADLNASQFLAEPPSFEVKIDERYGMAKFYANYSAIALLPRGGIALHDGSGAEMRIAGGTIMINAPGDIILTAGRSIAQWAGWDAAIRANNCVDIMANFGDVRIEADEKIMIMGGNNTCGGVLIESKGDGTAFAQNNPEDFLSGIIIRCPTATLAVIAKVVYVNTAINADANSHIIFDAGAGDIVTRSTQFRRHVNTVAFDFIGSGNYEYWPTQTWLPGDLLFPGTSQPGTKSHDLSTLITASLKEITFLVDTTDVAIMSFYWRTSTDCKTTDFQLFEPLWQQWARLNMQNMPQWQENTVANNFHGTTAAWPSWDTLNSDSSFAKIDLNLFDFTTNAPVDRGGIYEAPETGAVTETTLDKNWSVIINP
jgi:hypothetical protein